MAISLAEGERRRALAVVFAVVFVDLLGFGLVIPILPYYVYSFGANEFVIGLLAASYSVTQFLFAPLLGNVSDRYGRRPVILVSVGGTVLAWLAFGLAPSLLWLFGSRLLAGAAGGNLAAAQAYVADVTEPAKRAQALGLLGAAFGLGFVFGPALGAVLSYPAVVAAADAVIPVLPITHYTLPAFGAAFLAAANLAFAFVALPESRRVGPGGRSARRTMVGQLLAAVRTPGLRGLVAAFFLLSLAFSGVQVMFIPFVAGQYGYGSSQAAVLLAYIGVLAVVVQGGIVGPLTRRYDEVTLTVASAGVLVVALAAVPFSPTVGDVFFAWVPAVTPWFTPALVGLLATLALLSFGNGVLNVTLAALVSGRASAETQGSAFGVTQGAGSLARTVGPVLMGALYVLGYALPFLAGAALMLLALVITARFTRSDDAEAEEPPLPDPGHAR